jgi:hypothetical protein
MISINCTFWFTNCESQNAWNESDKAHLKVIIRIKRQKEHIHTPVRFEVFMAMTIKYAVS